MNFEFSPDLPKCESKLVQMMDKSIRLIWFKTITETLPYSSEYFGEVEAVTVM